VKILALPARDGLAWIRDGLRLFVRNPLSLPGAVAAGLLLVWLPSMVPWVGPAIATLIAPLASLGLMAACRAAAAGLTPRATVYVEALRDPQARRQLLTLGLINMLIVLPLVAIAQFTGLDRAIDVVQPPGGQPTLDVHPGLLALRIAVSTPLLMAMWLAPPLIAWERLPAAKAMFYSFFACWRNRWPMLVFIGVALGAGSLAILIAATMVDALVRDEAAAALLIAPLYLVLVTVMQAALFRMYSGIVEPDPVLQN
jgi:hypothetical protein